MFYKVTTKPSFRLLSITQILMTYWCLPGGRQSKETGHHWLDPSNGLWWSQTSDLPAHTSHGPYWLGLRNQLAVELWRKSDNWPWISICDHVSPLPLQSVSLTGWRKWAWCLMIIWLAGNPFVSGVIWLPVEEMTWALEDRKTVSLVLCRTVASFL